MKTQQNIPGELSDLTIIFVGFRRNAVSNVCVHLTEAEIVFFCTLRDATNSCSPLRVKNNNFMNFACKQITHQ